MEKSEKKEIVIRDFGENPDTRIPIRDIVIFCMTTLFAAGFSFLYKPETAIGIIFKVFICFCVIFNVMVSAFMMIHIMIISIYSRFHSL